MKLLKQSSRSQYRLLGLVGQGQYGRVYCAVHRRTGRLVALKQLQAQFPTRQFLRELRFLLTLTHPNIVTCQAIEHTSQGRSLVMDYCEGGTLRSLLARAPLPPQQAVQLVCDILAGLSHAHSHGIIHCDIKPDNVLLAIASTGWSARLSDFGIARLSQELIHSSSGQTGSPAYMAPERFYGQYSPRSDLYSVGVILFELLTGDRPFSGTPLELMSAHLNLPIPLPNSIPVALRTVVETALQKLPARRFRSATQMQAALSAALPLLQNDRLQNDRPSVRLRSIAPAAPERLTDRVDALAVSEIRRYWATSSPHGTLLHCGNTVVPVPALVRSLILRPQGCFVLTATKLYLQPIDSADLQFIASIAPQAKVAIAPDGKWFVAVAADAIAIGTASTNTLLVYPADATASCEVVVLTSRHFAIARACGCETQIEVWTRQGQRIACFQLAAGLEAITPTRSRHRFLAIDRHQPNCLLRIGILPLQIERIELAIAPRWMASFDWGDVCVDAQGRIVLIDALGQLCEQKIDGLSAPTAVAAIDSHLEIATWTAKIGTLYRLNLNPTERSDG